MRKIWRFVMALLLPVLFLAPTSCITKAPPAKYEDTRDMMDTYITVTVYSENETLAHEAISAAFTRMEDIANSASIYDEKAEAFRLNRDGYIDNPSPDLLQLIKKSLEYNKISNGYFDITVQPLLDIWSAGLWQQPPEVQQTKVNETMKLIGSDKIEVTDERISFKVPGMKITLGAITKGYAADEALKVISDMGIKSALVAAGGDISSLGTKPNKELWTIALVNPDNTQESLAAFQFGQKSISTSGNYERYFSPDKKVSHIMNPKTGYSVAESISVTIIAASGIEADALATAVFAMGPDAGLQLVESLKDVQCFIVDNNREIHTSSGIDKYLVKS